MEWILKLGIILRSKRVIMGIIFVLLFFDFGFNLFGFVSESEYKMFQLDTDASIYNRVLLSMDKGLFYSHGFLQNKPGATIEDYLESQKLLMNGQFSERQHTVDYYSNTGFHGLVYTIIYMLIPFSYGVKFKVLLLLTPFLSAVVLTFFLEWVYEEFSRNTALILMFYMLISKWLVVMSKSIGWNFWSNYLPMVIVFYFLMREERIKRYFLFQVSLLMFMSNFLSSLTGYQFETNILTASTIPIFYYAISRKWDIKKFILRFSVVSFSGIFGVFAAMFVHFIQRAICFGGFNKAIKLLFFDFERRTHGLQSDDIPAINVLKVYITENMKLFIALVIFFILYYLITYRKINSARLNAVTVSTCVSFVASISWYIVAKNHSLDHPHIFFSLWSLTFTFFGVILIIEFLKRILRQKSIEPISKHRFGKILDYTRCFFWACAIILSTLIIYLSSFQVGIPKF